jgi:NAD(P)-dependent dehydrogenase (short-subunit alcohol dehydrogenase family)
MTKLIAVTGASRGIGAAVAARLAEDEFYVACLSRSGAAPAVATISDAARNRLILRSVDVSKEADFRATLASLGNDAMPLVGLVNNAGFHVEAPSAVMAIDQWDEVMATNATSVVVGSQAAYPFLKAAGGGLIVNIGSFFDKLGVRKNLAYCASKAAVGAITRVLAVEWARDSIAVLNIAPGFILTDLNRADWEKEGGVLKSYIEQRTPGRKPGHPDDIATLIASLFAMGRPFLTGETIYVDGGQALVS